MPDLSWILWSFSLASLLDILIVAGIFYWIITIIQGTRGAQLVWGIALLLIILGVLNTLRQFVVLNTLIQQVIFPALIVAIPVVFQPELRRALEQLGHTGALLNRPFAATATQERQSSAIDEVCSAVGQLARQRFGALIVLERDTGLQDYVERAVAVEALATHELLVTLFFPNTPLHDGAVIVRDDRIVAAAAVLPLTEQPLGGNLGTRHRAAVGISEQSDAVAVVVSEETGQLSVAFDGRLTRNVTPERLRRTLMTLLHLERPLLSEAPSAQFTD